MPICMYIDVWQEGESSIAIHLALIYVPTYISLSALYRMAFVYIDPSSQLNGGR